MGTFQTMPALVAGQVLTAEALNRYRENAEYLLALEAFGSPAFRVARGGATGATTTAIWSGVYHHWGTTLGYGVRVASVGASPSFVIQMEIAGVWTAVATQGSLTADDTYNGTASLTGLGLTKGTVYPVRVNSTNAVIEVNRLYSYGSLTYSWQAFAATTNGTVWTTAEWGALRNNLLYLWDQLAGAWTPTSPITLTAITNGGISGDAGRLPDATPWRGYLHHRSDYLAYQIGGQAHDTNATSGAILVPSLSQVTATSPTTYNTGKAVGFLYNAGSANKYGDYPPVTGTDNDNTAGAFTISGYAANIGHQHQPYLTQISTSTDAIPATSYPLSGIARGTWLEARLSRVDGNAELYDATLLALFETAGVPDLTGWVSLAAFAHGDYPIGAGGKVADLVANCTELKARIDNYPSFLIPYTASAYFVHRSDVLIWSGTNVTLSYTQGPWPARGLASQTITLGTSATPATFDLRSLSGLEYGGLYWLTESNSAGDTLYAYEVPEGA